MEEKKILIVDDELEMRRLLATFFEKKGFRAVAVESGLLGLRILSRTGFDALISDIKMPFMDGLEFAAKARKFNPDLVIIMLTGYGSLDAAQQAIRIGAKDFFTKPVELEKLHDSVESGVAAVKKKKKDSEYYLKLQLELKADKDKLDAAKDELISLIGHELRTPMAVITEGFDIMKGMIEAPGEERMGALTADKKEGVFKAIDHGRRRLLGTIEDITYYLDLNKGSIRLNKAKADLRDLLGQSIDGFKQLLSGTKSTLEEKLSDGGAYAEIDKEKFLDVVARLINNASHHNSEGCRIFLELSSVMRQGGDKENRFIRIAVRDNGQGIDAKIFESIFSPFSATDMMHHSRGLGFGLAICKKVVDLHQGHITVESVKGEGASIIIEIPAV